MRKQNSSAILFLGFSTIIYILGFLLFLAYHFGANSLGKNTRW